MNNSDGNQLVGSREFLDANIYKPSNGFRVNEAFRISVKCPHCGQIGMFDTIHNVNDATFAREFKYNGALGDMLKRSVAQFAIGIRMCPNSACHGAICMVAELTPGDNTLVASSPPILIDIRSDNIPSNIAESLKEAVASNSVQAFRASTLMVRRSLELLCQAKGAKGGNLKERIANLAKHVILPPALLEAADELRILGNDAAHVEAHDYDDINKEHSDLAIEVAKKILEAVYQHDDLISRLKSLKKPIKT